MGIVGLALLLLVLAMLTLSCVWLLLQSWKHHDERLRPERRKPKQRDIWQASGDRLVSQINNQVFGGDTGDGPDSDGDQEHDSDTDDPGGGGQPVR